MKFQNSEMGGKAEVLNKEAITEMGFRIFYTAYFVLFSLCLASCQSKVENKDYSQFLTQKIEKRDSLLILHTAREWGNRNFWTWEDYSKMYQISQEQVKYFIDGTFYSPDRKKILVWVGERLPNAKTIESYREDRNLDKVCPTAGDTVYMLTALIGIRDSINQMWDFYPFDRKSVVCAKSKAQAKSILGKFYFEEMKDNSDLWMVQSGEMKGQKQPRNYGYNLQDKAFWDSCWLFEKDTVGSYGLCIFQLIGYDCMGKPYNKDCGDPYKIPKIIYPDSILRLYGRE